MDIAETCFWIVYMVIIVIAIEVFAYFWHRFGAHSDIIPGIHDAHRLHHMVDLEYGHEAHEDFIWTLLMLTLFELGLGFGVSINLIPGKLAIITLVVSIIVFFWNWWIHTAYHKDGHWLNRYHWFRIEKARHYVHHRDPTKNFGIASHFTDKFMDTWIDLNSNVLTSNNISI